MSEPAIDNSIAKEYPIDMHKNQEPIIEHLEARTDELVETTKTDKKDAGLIIHWNKIVAAVLSRAKAYDQRDILNARIRELEAGLEWFYSAGNNDTFDVYAQERLEAYKKERDSL